MPVAGAAPAPAVAGPQVHCQRSAPAYKFGNPVSEYDDLVTAGHGPGGTRLTVTLPQGSKLTTTPGARLPTGEAAFVRAARQQVAPTVARAKTQPRNRTFRWTVPAKWKTGYLHAGGERYRTPWQYGRITTTCRFHVIAQGLSHLAYAIPASWHNRRAVGGGNVN